ncbi:hypothetical protein ACUY3H_07290 [Corynebacterium ureicelerivorans]
MTTENEGLYTSTDNATDPNATEASKDGANNPNQSMDTLPLGEGVRTVEEAEHHEEGARWNDGNLPREESANDDGTASGNDSREQER